MQWGEYTVFLTNGFKFFTGTKDQCELVLHGIHMAGGTAELLKANIITAD
jgi:hypothetical protein